MKKFKWRLQRLLDVRQKQEDALRAELMGLTEKAAALRGRILMEKAMLRSRLADVREAAPSERIARQQMFMAHVAVLDARIAELEHDLKNIEVQRRQKTEAALAIRKFRKALERLKAKAQDAYACAANAQEQKALDENTNAGFARRMSESSQHRL